MSALKINLLPNLKKKLLGVIKRTLAGTLIVFIFFSICGVAFGSAIPDSGGGGAVSPKIDIPSNDEIQDKINSEEGSLFEKLIATLIGACASGVTFFVTSIMGFDSLNNVVFNNGLPPSGGIAYPAPFTQATWGILNDLYIKIVVISVILLLIGVTTTAYRFIHAGYNPRAREEAKDSLMRLLFSGIMMALAPLFVRVMLYVNNILVYILSGMGPIELDNYIGFSNNILMNIKTGSAIATAFVICLFAYLTIKINLMFIIRYFNIIIFYIFTPVVVVMWVINKNVNAAGIWLGEMISNAFMQAVYAFVFAIYLSIVGPMETGWTTPVIWGLLIMPIADVLRNSMQGALTRISGLNESAVASGALGVIGLAGLPSMLSAFTSQFAPAAGSAASGIFAGFAQGASGALFIPPAGSGGTAGSGGIVGKLATANNIGYYTERGIRTALAPIAMFGGQEAQTAVNGAASAVGMLTRGVSGAILTGAEIKQKGKEGFYQELGAKGNYDAFKKTISLNVSNIASGQNRVRAKAQAYNINTSIDGMRWR